MDTVPGSAATELITAGSTTLTTSDTLQAADQIDGGAGRDTLNLAITKNFGGFTVGSGFLKNVETVNLNNSSITGVTFTAKAVEGVETYNITGPVSVSGMDSLKTGVNVKDVNTATAATVTIGYDSTKTTGSSDAVTVGISNVGVKSTSSSNAYDTASSFAATIVDVDGIEAITLNLAGANYMTLSGDKATSTVATGAGSLVLSTVPTTLKSFDGSTGSGAQTVRFNDGTTKATSVTTVKTGSGNDVITAVESTDLRADATVSGGDGTDTLVILNSAASHTAAYAMSGIETVQITGGVNGVIFAPSSATGLTKVSLGATQTGGAHTISVGTQAIAIDVNVASTANTASTTTPTVSNKAAATLNFVTTASSATANVQNITFSDATSLDINLAKNVIYGHNSDTNATASTITATKATAVSVSGEGQFGHKTDGLVLPAATSLTVNQQSQNQIWYLGVSNSAASTDALKTLNITQAGTVTLTGDALDGVESLIVSAETPFTYTADFAKATSVALSGSRDASSVTLGDLGDANAYGLTITATALKAGLTIEDLEVGAGQTLSVDLTGKTGSGDTNIDAVRVGDVDNTPPASLTGTVSINGKSASSTGSLNIEEEIYAKTVTVDLSGSSFGSGTSEEVNIAVGAGGTVDGVASTNIDGTAATITGESVVIKSPSAPLTFNVGNIHAKNSLVFDGPTTVSANAAEVAITAHTGSTALNVTLNGGLAGDTFTITGLSTQTGITVSGDLKGDAGGTDKVTITSSASTASAGQAIDVSGLADSTTSIIGSAGKDTITGSAGNDTIKAGLSADTIILSSGGSDVVLLTGPQDTGEVTSITTSAGVTTSSIANWTATATTKINAGSYVSTSNLDKVIGFATGDKIVTNARADAVEIAEDTVLQTIGELIGVGRSLTSSTVVLGQATDATGSIDAFIPGTYDASNNRFTFNASGADTLYMFEQDGSKDKTTADFFGIVLVGYAAGGTSDATNAGFTGLIGGALGS